MDVVRNEEGKIMAEVRIASGWNDYELPMVNIQEQPVDIETADDYFTSRVREDQMKPK